MRQTQPWTGAPAQAERPAAHSCRAPAGPTHATATPPPERGPPVLFPPGAAGLPDRDGRPPGAAAAGPGPAGRACGADTGGAVAGRSVAGRAGPGQEAVRQVRPATAVELWGGRSHSPTTSRGGPAGPAGHRRTWRAGRDSPPRRATAEQLDRVVTCAERPNVSVHVVQAARVTMQGSRVRYRSPIWVTAVGLDTSKVSWAAMWWTSRSSLATLFERWESIRNEALPRRQSLNLIKEVANQWT